MGVPRPGAAPPAPGVESPAAPVVAVPGGPACADAPRPWWRTCEAVAVGLLALLAGWGTALLCAGRAAWRAWAHAGGGQSRGAQNTGAGWLTPRGPRAAPLPVRGAVRRALGDSQTPWAKPRAQKLMDT